MSEPNPEKRMPNERHQLVVTNVESHLSELYVYALQYNLGDIFQDLMKQKLSNMDPNFWDMFENSGRSIIYNEIEAHKIDHSKDDTSSKPYIFTLLPGEVGILSYFSEDEIIPAVAMLGYYYDENPITLSSIEYAFQFRNDTHRLLLVYPRSPEALKRPRQSVFQEKYEENGEIQWRSVLSIRDEEDLRTITHFNRDQQLSIFQEVQQCMYDQEEVAFWNHLSFIPSDLHPISQSYTVTTEHGFNEAKEEIGKWILLTDLSEENGSRRYSVDLTLDPEIETDLLSLVSNAREEENQRRSQESIKKHYHLSFVTNHEHHISQAQGNVITGTNVIDELQIDLEEDPYLRSYRHDLTTIWATQITIKGADDDYPRYKRLIFTLGKEDHKVHLFVD